MTVPGIIVARRFAQYRDKPGYLYHFPKERYLRVVEALTGSLVLVYEPRRGRVSATALHGGRSSFVGFAFLGAITDDPEDASCAFVETRNFCEFAEPVPVAQSGVNGKALERAVQLTTQETVDRILARGLSPVLARPPGVVREGLVDLDAGLIGTGRTVHQLISERKVRDASFRYRVVEVAYKGTCAITGLRLTNGNGRAEADAAHIMPVERGGPDSTRNGIALSKTMHWAFDRGLISLTD